MMRPPGKCCPIDAPSKFEELRETLRTRRLAASLEMTRDESSKAAHEKGQASLEFLLVGIVLMALIGALSSLWHFISKGGLSQLIEESASHGVGDLGGVFDALLF